MPIFCNIGGETPTSNDWGLELWVSRLFFCWVLPLFKSVPITAKAFVLHTPDLFVFGQPPSTGCTSFILCGCCLVLDPVDPGGGARKKKKKVWSFFFSLFFFFFFFFFAPPPGIQD